MINLILVWLCAGNSQSLWVNFFVTIENISLYISQCQCLSLLFFSIADQWRHVNYYTLHSLGKRSSHLILFFKITQIQVKQNPTKINFERDIEQVMKKPKPHIKWQLSLLQLDCNFLNTRQFFLSISSL